MFTRSAHLLGIVLTGLLAGLFTGRWLGAPASRQYDGPVFTEVQQRVDATVGQWARDSSRVRSPRWRWPWS